MSPPRNLMKRNHQQGDMFIILIMYIYIYIYTHMNYIYIYMYIYIYIYIYIYNIYRHTSLKEICDSL